MDYSSFVLNSLFTFPSMYQGVPDIASKGLMKGQIQVISRHREGYDSNESDPCQGKLQKDLDYAHIPWLYRVKNDIYHFSYVFRDDQGNIKGQKMVHGV